MYYRTTYIKIITKPENTRNNNIYLTNNATATPHQQISVIKPSKPNKIVRNRKFIRKITDHNWSPIKRNLWRSLIEVRIIHRSLRWTVTSTGCAWGYGGWAGRTEEAERSSGLPEMNPRKRLPIKYPRHSHGCTGAKKNV